MQKKSIVSIKFLVCSVMENEPEPLCAFDIAAKIKERFGRNIYLCNLYPLLSLLNDRGFLSHSIAPKRGIRGGRKRKVYALTPLGHEYIKRPSESE